MADDADYIVDIGSTGRSEPANDDQENEGTGQFKGRPFISVFFECCQVYNRIYRNVEGTAYIGRCPRCSREVNVRVGPGGVSGRFFKAT